MGPLAGVLPRPWPWHWIGLSTVARRPLTHVFSGCTADVGVAHVKCASLFFVMSVPQFSMLCFQVVVRNRPLSCEHKGRRDLVLPLSYCHGVSKWDSTSGRASAGLVSVVRIPPSLVHLVSPNAHTLWGRRLSACLRAKRADPSQHASPSSLRAIVSISPHQAKPVVIFVNTDLLAVVYSVRVCRTAGYGRCLSP